MKSYSTKFKSFWRKIVQMGALRKLQNSIQTLVIFWPVYPIHTNSLFWVTFEKLSFCHFLPPNTSIRGKDSQFRLIFHLNILVFQANGKQPYSFPVLSRFCNGLLETRFSRAIKIRGFNQIKKFFRQITPQNKLYYFSEKNFLVLGAL